LITLAYIGAFAASSEALGGGPGIAPIGAVYLGAAAIAAAAPSPGGLGALEAALVAGLTGVGMAAGPAVSAVLLYRLATYWLPVAPGWLCWRGLQRRGGAIKGAPGAPPPGPRGGGRGRARPPRTAARPCPPLG